ncbi:MAG: DUF2283 domain-containing protein [Candidatus Woesearchaeota archaeon]
MEEKNFDYDGVSDSLIVSRKKIDEKVQGSAEIGNLILDFTSSGRVVSVEIQHISKFLEMMNISPDILDELTSVDLIVQNQRGDLFLAAILHTPTLKQPLPLTTVPITNELASSV